ncbi:hypothetical protein B0H13DRAFT_2662275 [Mycena leptocephala]|nr:hypothetical protein B0H13DRAFT_2662275 [Mycena leptocephala]
MAFIDIPLDVLMEISRDLDLQDSLHLIGTCTTFTSILLSRYFWIATLNRLEKVHRRPPPCSPGLDILTLPLATLKKLAIHAYKLKANWSSQSPRHVSVQTIEMEDYVKDIIPIQGTSLIITVSPSRLACWDTISGECIGAFHHATKPHGIDALSPIEFYPLLRPGSCSIGIIYASSSPNTFELAIICVDHRKSSAVEISKTFSKIWTPPDTEHYSVSVVVVDTNAIAAIMVKNSEDTAFLLFCCLEDGIIRTVPLGSNENATLPRCIIFQDDFYVTRQYFEPKADIIHIQTSVNEPYFSTHKTVITVPSSDAGPTSVTSLGFCNLRVPEYGVLNVTLKTAYRSDEDDDLINSLHFWPAEYHGSTLTVDSLCFYEHSCDIVAVAIGSSATSGIAVDEDRALGLVQYLPHPTPHVTFTRLDIPDLKIPDIGKWTMAFDDRLGVLYIGICHSEGPRSRAYHVSVVSYA